MSLIKTEIGTIAPDWKVVSLKEVAEKPQYGLTAKAADSGDIKFLRITDITDQGVNWATVPFCSAPKNKIDKCRLQPGDIVFARIGATTGKSYMISDPPDAVFASYLIRIRPGENLEPGFLIQFFQSRGYWQQVNANKHANLKKGVNSSILSDLLVPLPPLPEQKKIAHILSTVQGAIQAQERIIAMITELKNALMDKLFTEGLRAEPQKETEIGLVPENWAIVPIGDLTTSVYRYPTYYGISYVKEGIPEVRGELLLKNGEIEEDTTKFRYISAETASRFSKVRLEIGDIVMSVRGTMGKIGIVRKNLRGAVITANLIRLAPKTQRINPEFFRWALLTPRFVESLNSASPKTTIRTITAPVLKRLCIPLPNKQDQEEIVAALNSIDARLAIHYRKKTSLQDLFHSLLHELMTAQVRVNDLDLSQVEESAAA